MPFRGSASRTVAQETRLLLASTRYYNQFWKPKLRLRALLAPLGRLLEPVNEFWQTQNPRSSFGLAAARRARVAPCGHVGIDESAFLRFSIY